MAWNAPDSVAPNQLCGWVGQEHGGSIPLADRRLGTKAPIIGASATASAEDIPIYNGRGCTLLELSQGKCRWPISNPGAEDFCFCGNEPVKGLPYCPGHARIAYRSVGRQRSSAGA